MNSMIFVVLLVTVIMGTDRVIGGKQHNTSGQTIAGMTPNGKHIKSFAAKQLMPSNGSVNRDEKDRKMYFQSSAKPQPEDFMQCIDKEMVRNAWDKSIVWCLVDKWVPLPSAPMPFDQRECCFFADKVCAKDKLYNSECTPMDGYPTALVDDYKRVTDLCKGVGFEVSYEFCSTLYTFEILRPECQRYQHCKPSIPTVSPVVTPGGAGGHDPNTSAPGQGSGPVSPAKPKLQHSGADIKSPLSFAVISLLAFITFIQM